MRAAHIGRILIPASLALLVAQAATAKTVQVGTCLPHLQTYSTISKAVSAVAPGTTVLVCPGSYPEQVMITQPLTLRGVSSGNEANPTLTVPPGGLKKTYVNGEATFYYQLLMLSTAPGAVNISNLAVNGSNNNVPASGAIAGIFYQDSLGTVNRVAVYNQAGNGRGYSVVLEQASLSPITVNVINSSLHDFDQGGIGTGGNLTANIRSNEIVTSTSSDDASYTSGIILFSNGTIANNRVITTQPPGISVGFGISVQSDTVVVDNTVENFAVGISLAGNSNTASSNKVFLTNYGMWINGTNNDVEHNSFVSLRGGAEAISFGCAGTGNTVIHNFVNDAKFGIYESHGTNTISPNTFSNVAQLISPTC